jgi:hypothetical protein
LHSFVLEIAVQVGEYGEAWYVWSCGLRIAVQLKSFSSVLAVRLLVYAKNCSAIGTLEDLSLVSHRTARPR